MSNCNCCFLICIQISQEAGQVVCYSHLFLNFPQFVMIHTAKGFGIVNKAEMDVFLELPCFLMSQWILAILSLVPLPFLKPAWISGSSQFTYCWSLAWRILSITLLACEVSAIVHSLSMKWKPLSIFKMDYHEKSPNWSLRISLSTCSNSRLNCYSSWLF